MRRLPKGPFDIVSMRKSSRHCRFDYDLEELPPLGSGRQAIGKYAFKLLRLCCTKCVSVQLSLHARCALKATGLG